MDERQPAGGVDHEVKKLAFFIYGLFVFLPLVRAESPEEKLKVKLPPVVIVGEETLRAEALGRIPLPTLITTVQRETPPLEVVELGREAERVMERPSPTVRSPGCAYSTALGTSVARVIEGIEALYKRGLYLYVRGEREAARATFRKVLEKYPKSLYASMALYWLGEMDLEEGHEEEALRHFERLWKEYPASPYEDYALQSGAWILMKNRRYGEALEVVRKLKEAVPRSPLVDNAYLLEAYIRVLQGDPEGAEAAALSLLKRGRKFLAEGLYLHSLSLFAMGRYEEASKAIAKFLKDYPGHPLREGGLYIAGWVHWACGNLEGAARAFSSYLKGHPKGRWEGPVRWGLIKAFLGLDREKEAREVLKGLLSSPVATPWAGEGLYELARFLISRGREAEALPILERITKEYRQRGLLQRAYLLMGEVLSRRGEYLRAAKCFGKATEGKETLSLYAMLNEALALYHAGKASQAVDIWRDLLKRLPQTHPLRERAVFFLGRGYLALDKPAEALSAFRELPRDSDLFRKGLLALGWYHFHKGHWREAARWALRAGGPRGEFLRALALFNAKDYREALKLFRLLERSEGLEEEVLRRALFYEGLCHYKLEEFAKAASRFEELIRRWPQAPTVPEALYWWGWSLLRMGRWKNAEKLFLKVATEFPSHPLAPKAWLKVGDCRYNRGEYDRAVFAYLKVKNAYPQADCVPDAYWGIVLSYYNAGKEERFKLWADQFIKTHPRHPLAANVLLLLGSHHEAKGNLASAEVCYRKVIEQFPGTPGVEEARLRLAQLLQGMGRAPEALKVLGEVGKLPYRWKALEERATICLALGRKEEAKGYLWELVEQASEDFAFRAALKGAEVLGTEATELLRTVLRRFPGSARSFEVSLKLGELYQKAGRHEEAFQWFSQAAEEAPTEGIKAKCELKMASALIGMGRTDEALEQALKVLYLHPEEKEAGALALLMAAEIYRARGEGAKAEQACRRALKLSRDEEVLRKAKDICGAKRTGTTGRRSKVR